MAELDRREQIDRTLAEALLDGLTARSLLDDYSIRFDKTTRRYHATGRVAGENWETGSNVYAFYAAEQLARQILYHSHGE